MIMEFTQKINIFILDILNRGHCNNPSYNNKNILMLIKNIIKRERKGGKTLNK